MKRTSVTSDLGGRTVNESYAEAMSDIPNNTALQRYVAVSVPRVCSKFNSTKRMLVVVEA